MAISKVCNGCRASKVLEQFDRHVGMPFDRRSHCKDCRTEQRRKKAEVDGREFLTPAMRAERKAVRLARITADRDQRRVEREKRAAGKLTDTERYRTDPVFREQAKRESREQYHRRIEVARNKVAKYKAEHQDRVMRWHEVRAMRVELQSDGTLTQTRIDMMKRASKECAYCAVAFDDGWDKQTDHVLALCHGGAHSERNVVICCAKCNGQKSRLTPSEWLDRVAPEHRDRVRSAIERSEGSCQSEAA